MKYYNLNPILKKNAVYNIIIGQRSNGKTYGLLKYAVQRYFRTGKQFAIIRRWDVDIKMKRATAMFNSINDDGIVVKASKGDYTHIVYSTGKFYTAIYDDELKKYIYSDDNICGYIFSIAAMEHDKSISFPNVETIIFDEFLSSNHNYLFNEFNLFMDVVSTIVRNRDDVKIFMLGNTVDRYSPYFTNMGLNHITEQKQGTIEVYTYGDSKLTVAVEYCENLKTSKSSNNFYFAFNNPHLQMIKSGVWDLGLYPNKPCDFTNKDIQFIFFIIYNENIYQCEIVFIDDYNFIYIHEKTTEIKDTKRDIIYSCEYVPQLNYTQNLLKPIYKVNQKILWYFLNNRVYYQNNSVGNAINSYIKDCKKGDF